MEKFPENNSLDSLEGVPEKSKSQSISLDAMEGVPLYGTEKESVAPTILQGLKLPMFERDYNAPPLKSWTYRMNEFDNSFVSIRANTHEGKVQLYFVLWDKNGEPLENTDDMEIVDGNDNTLEKFKTGQLALLYSQIKEGFKLKKNGKPLNLIEFAFEENSQGASWH